MPEGDSVFKLARRLDRSLLGRTVVRTDLRVPRLATRTLDGRVVEEHVTHGKHLLTRFSDGVTLHSHLLMDGSWSVTGPGKQLPRRLMPEVRVVLGLDDGHTAYGLNLHQLDLVATGDEHRLVGHLGPDPLRDDWDPDEAVRRIAADPTRPLVSALLDQTGMAGIGNLWANELAFLVGRSPWTPVGEVDLDALVRLAAKALKHSALVPGAYQVTTGATGVARTTGSRGATVAPACAAARRSGWCPRSATTRTTAARGGARPASPDRGPRDGGSRRTTAAPPGGDAAVACVR